ncbi:PKD domain-containing protein [Flammeovirga yaeyamensis]|uniref:PKD domain-containing protein n=1 Tax=Flammeovirga yaeyamensis TaxID=367791 RepID=A0AAX1N6Q4_9BACT|nr:PKD domain-containing protein [Flammeovirga yaeyamensis]MBB3697834.1 PKD repeat protein [Flammeovirga yaeyamensis]NMF35810.1 PKD domain-containing protein [Flammeovirga yaeyamensis]QWG03238.1 PKD domain-containing protein [Flammeovirga yaeyamensis]
MKTIIMLSLLCMALFAHAQGNRLIVEKSDGTKTKIFMNGGNLAWDQFANDFGPGATNFDYFDEVFTNFENAGGNSMRLWIHINGANNPNLDGNGKCIGLEESHIEDMRGVLNLAYNHNIVLVMSLWSFDMLNNRDYPLEVSEQGYKILTEEANVQAYIDNALIPMVEAFKDHPAVGAWEIFNEPEGMSDEFGWSHTRHVPMSVIQRFVNRCTGAIHRVDPEAQVTNGTWSMYAGTDIYNSQNPIYKNYYSDEELINAGGDSLGVLDFYQIHYYEWMNNEISVMHHPASYWQLDKPILVGEFYPLDAKGIAWQTYHDLLYNSGYAGAMSWQWYGEKGQIEPYRTNMVALMESIRDYPDIQIESGRNRFPTISKIDNGLFYRNADPVSNYVDLDSIANDPDNDPLTFSVKSNSNPSLVSVSINSENQVGLSFTSEMVGEATIVIEVTDAGGLTAISEFNIAVREAGTGNLALFRTTVYSSSNEPGTSTADPIFATDGDYNTRWSSAYEDPTWYYVDLGATYQVSQVKLFWEAAYGQRYEIQLSDDATNWTTVYTENSGDGGEDDIIFPASAARYIRMYGVQRGTSWGYSLYEFEVYGEGSVNQSPSATITATPTSGNTPLDVSLDGSLSSDPDGSIVSYEWNFGDSTATGVTSSVRYTEKGTYTIQLKVTDDKGATDSTSVTIVVNDPNNPNIPPIAIITATPISGTEPLTVNFNASSSSDTDGSIASYDWDFGDGTSGNDVEVNHTFNTTGTYQVVLLVTDNEGAASQDTVTITVDPWAPCGNPTPITVPFVKNGAGEFCWVTSEAFPIINSWNLDLLEINGVDLTNKYSQDIPEPINGQWTIHYIGSFNWSHFHIEAPTTPMAATQAQSVYPNPFTNTVTVDLKGTNASKVELIDENGQVLNTYSGDQLNSDELNIEINSAGSQFFVRIYSGNEIIVRRIYKQ